MGQRYNGGECREEKQQDSCHSNDSCHSGDSYSQANYNVQFGGENANAQQNAGLIGVQLLSGDNVNIL